MEDSVEAHMDLWWDILLRKHYEGGLIAFVEDDDIIEIDATKNTITLKVSDEEIAETKKQTGNNLH